MHRWLFLELDKIDIAEDFDSSVLDKIDAGAFFPLHADEGIFAELLKLCFRGQNKHHASWYIAHKWQLLEVGDGLAQFAHDLGFHVLAEGRI